MMLKSAVYLLFFCCFLVACGGSDGVSGADGVAGADGRSLLVESSDATECEAGGTLLTFGYDTTGDGVIDEVSATKTLCNGNDGAAGEDGIAGEDGRSILVESAPAETSECPADGITFTFGYDTTGDGSIDTPIDTQTVCDGEDGAPGEDGNSILVESAPAAASDCPADGITFSFGYDTTGDGSIDTPVDTQTICDGEQGAPGEPADELTVEQSPATACLAPGTTLTFGYDTTGDGSIDVVVESVDVCEKPNVLYFSAYPNSGDTFLAALQGLDDDGMLTFTRTNNLTTALTMGSYDVVFFSRPSINPTAQEETALANWVNGGGSAIMSIFASNTSLLSLFQVSINASNLSSADFSGPLLGSGLGTVPVTNNSFNVYSQGYTPMGSAVSGCTWENGDSCAVVGNSGKTVALGFLMGTTSQADSDLIVENSLRQTLK